MPGYWFLKIPSWTRDIFRTRLRWVWTPLGQPLRQLGKQFVPPWLMIDGDGYQMALKSGESLRYTGLHCYSGAAVCPLCPCRLIQLKVTQQYTVTRQLRGLTFPNCILSAQAPWNVIIYLYKTILHRKTYNALFDV